MKTVKEVSELTGLSRSVIGYDIFIKKQEDDHNENS